jgi:type III restriction enzyme
MKVKLPLLENGVGAISFYREELEHLTGLRGAHPILAPLIQKFLEEQLFEERIDLFDPRLVSRLADTDVREHIRAAFVPLIRKKITFIESRVKQEEPQSVCWWKPFQVTHSERRPTITGQKTPFNLVPCNRELELALTHFLDNAPDVVAFVKNAGPQSLRID